VLDSHSDQQLAHVALHVLGRVEEKSLYGRWKLPASHGAAIRQRALVHGAELNDSLLHPVPQGLHQSSLCRSGRWRDAFRLELGPLHIRELLRRRIREESVHDTAHVLKMEAHTRNAARSRPELLVGEVVQKVLDILHGLQQRMRHRLKQRRHCGDRSSKPSFR
jgi:hypothetical protein